MKLHKRIHIDFGKVYFTEKYLHRRTLFLSANSLDKPKRERERETETETETERHRDTEKLKLVLIKKHNAD